MCLLCVRRMHASIHTSNNKMRLFNPQKTLNKETVPNSPLFKTDSVFRKEKMADAVPDAAIYSAVKLLVITCKEFLENTTLHGFKYTVQATKSTGEK